MGVRNETSADAIRARDAALAAEQERPAQPRPAPKAEHVDRFQQLMQQARGEEDRGRLKDFAHPASAGEDARAEARAAENAVSAIGDGHARDSAEHEKSSGLSHETLEQADAMAFLNAQMGLRGEAVAVPQQAPAPSANAQAMFDLVERHVRQMAVGGGGEAGGDGQVLLRMADSTLPGTDLLLTRTEAGWSLRADSRSRESYDAIREAGPELARRFAERNLGTLVVDPHFNG